MTSSWAFPPPEQKQKQPENDDRTSNRRANDGAHWDLCLGGWGCRAGDILEFVEPVPVAADERDRDFVLAGVEFGRRVEHLAVYLRARVECRRERGGRAVVNRVLRRGPWGAVRAQHGDLGAWEASAAGSRLGWDARTVECEGRTGARYPRKVLGVVVSLGVFGVGDEGPVGGVVDACICVVHADYC